MSDSSPLASESKVFLWPPTLTTDEDNEIVESVGEDGQYVCARIQHSSRVLEFYVMQLASSYFFSFSGFGETNKIRQGQPIARYLAWCIISHVQAIKDPKND